MIGVMELRLFSVHHADHGLAAVQRVSEAVPGLARRLVAAPEVDGAVVLATCNRVELYLDVAGEADEARLADHVGAALRAGLPDADDLADLRPGSRSGGEALCHLFEVGAGLDSMVVGEREVAGQLRRALRDAQDDGTASHLLTDVVERALRTARRVASTTELSARGRSVVTVALDLLGVEWSSARVLLIGTGSYAGAVVADLVGRGCAEIAVQSSSGRAEAFAAPRPGVRPWAGTLVDALAWGDVVVATRGAGVPAVTARDVAAALPGRAGRPLRVVDLAVTRDVEPDVGSLPGVALLDLSTVQRHVPDACAREVQRARAIVDSGVEEVVARLRARIMDPAVVALRDSVTGMVDDEVARLPVGRPVTRDEAAHALRRLAARLVHVPSVRARKAAEEGRAEEYLAALDEVYGIRPAVPLLPNLEIARAADAWVPPDSLDDDECPVTGLGLDDLGGHRRREAM